MLEHNHNIDESINLVDVDQRCRELGVNYSPYGKGVSKIDSVDKFLEYIRHLGDIPEKKVLNIVERGDIPVLFDYRSPLYAVKAEGAKVIPYSRITGMLGTLPLDRATLVQSLFSLLEKDNSMKSDSHFRDLITFEKRWLEYKDSPRSRKVTFRYGAKQIQEYYNLPFEVDEERLGSVFARAIAIVAKRIQQYIPKASLRPLSLEKAMESMPATTMGGTPYFEKGKLIFKQNGKEIITDNRFKYLDLAKKIVNNENVTDQVPYVNVWRGQETNKLSYFPEGPVGFNKQRGPGAESHAGTIIGSVAKPFTDARKRMPERAALVNQQAVDNVIHNAFKRLGRNDWLLGGDGSAYDAHMNPRIAISIMEHVVIPSFTGPPDVLVAFKKYVINMFNGQLLTPEGVYTGGHGMPSGTGGVNELDSLYNEVLVEAFNLIQDEIKLKMVTEQGDDAVIICSTNLPSRDDILKKIEYYYKMLGQEVNAKKQILDRNKTEYLKRLHFSDRAESYRSYVGSAIGMLNMERPKNGRAPMHTTRWLMQAANHYSNLPGFDLFMEGVSQGDNEYKLGRGKVKPQDIFSLAGGAKTVTKRLGYESYATHLGVTHRKDVAEISIHSLSSVRGVLDNPLQR